jgi:uncharacterized protein (UPF0333 family)
MRVQFSKQMNRLILLVVVITIIAIGYYFVLESHSFAFKIIHA